MQDGPVSLPAEQSGKFCWEELTGAQLSIKRLCIAVGSCTLLIFLQQVS